MKSSYKTFAILAGCVLALQAAKANTVVVDFEDRAGQQPFGNPIPAGYHGIDFSADFGTWDSPQFPYTPHSGSVRALVNAQNTGFGEVDFTFSAGPEVFDGAWFAGGGDGVQFVLYSGNAVVATSAVLTDSGTPAFLSSGYSGAVDKVGIIGNKGYYSLDDVQYESGQRVPDAGCTLGLLGAGVAALGFLRKRLVA